ncbi:MAG TPA: hypothetical protein VHO70_22980 [Chitinispirillaceae bacterium]|nr:hypothetical protein [Chitinispirillaceae bacterium]
MKFLIYSLSLVLLVGTLPADARNEQLHDSSFVQFLAGIYLLNNSTRISEKQKAEHYNELVHLTGITADSVEMIITRYYNKPDAWKKIQERIQTIYTEYENKIKNDTISTTTGSERSK